jgi:hypothetical protein
MESMEKLYRSLIPDFKIDEQITAPHLCHKEGIPFTLAFFKKIAAKNRDELTLGRSHVIGLADASKNVGMLLAEALIRSDLPAAEAVGLCWIYQYDTLSNPFQEFLETLNNQERPDLVRTGVALLHDLCQVVWTKRLALDDHPDEDLTDIEPFQAETFPDLMTVSKDQYNAVAWPDLLAGGSTLQGAGAWWNLGQCVTETIHNLATPKRAPAVVSIVLDIIQTIPDTRAWVANIILTIVEDHLTCGESLVWEEGLAPLTDRLSDDEAAALLAWIADTTIRNRPKNSTEKKEAFLGFVDKIGRRITSTHSNISVDNWLDPENILNSRLADNHNEYGTDRECIFEPPTVTTEMVLRDGNLVAVHTNQKSLISYDQAISLANVYDLMMTWLGPDRGKEMSPRIHEGLGRILEVRNLENFPVTALRSAMDNWRLQHSGALDQKHNSPGQTEEEPATPSTMRKRKI